MRALPKRGLYSERQCRRELAPHLEHGGFLGCKAAVFRVAAESCEPTVHALTQQPQLRTSWIQPIPILIVHSILSAHLEQRLVTKQSPTVARIELVPAVTAGDDCLDRCTLRAFYAGVKAAIQNITRDVTPR